MLVMTGARALNIIKDLFANDGLLAGRNLKELIV